MKYPYIPESELSMGPAPLKAGTYRFTIVEASETVSKSSGLPMMKLRLNCRNDDERVGVVFDYLVASKTQVWKIKQLADSVGDPTLYAPDVELTAPMLINQQGCVEVCLAKSPGYADSAKVKFYIAAQEVAPDVYADVSQGPLPDDDFFSPETS